MAAGPGQGRLGGSGCDAQQRWGRLRPAEACAGAGGRPATAAAVKQGSGGVARRSGDGRGRRPRGEAARRPAQLGGTGARSSTAQGRVDGARGGHSGGARAAAAARR